MAASLFRSLAERSLGNNSNQWHCPPKARVGSLVVWSTQSAAWGPGWDREVQRSGLESHKPCDQSFGPDATGPPASSVPWVPRGLGGPQKDSISVTVVSPTKDVFTNVSDPQGNLLVCNKPRGTQGKMTDGPRACRLWLLVSLGAEVSS